MLCTIVKPLVAGVLVRKLQGLQACGSTLWPVLVTWALGREICPDSVNSPEYLLGSVLFL